MSRNVSTVESSIEELATIHGHDLKLVTFDTDGNPVWSCVNSCGLGRVTLFRLPRNGWRLDGDIRERCGT